MKSFILSSLMLAVCAMVSGCGEEKKVETSKTVSTPGGSSKETVIEKKVDKGDMKDTGTGTGATTSKP